MTTNTERYRITESRVFVDLYRLLTSCFASDHLNSLRDDLDTPYLSVLNLRDACEKEEIHELLLKLAASYRVQQDQVPGYNRSTGRANVNPYHDKCGVLYADTSELKTQVLTLREACNKIIHATGFEHVYKRNNQIDDWSLAPRMILHGERNGTEWKAELDILLFVDCLFYNFKLD